MRKVQGGKLPDEIFLLKSMPQSQSEIVLPQCVHVVVVTPLRDKSKALPSTVVAATTGWSETEGSNHVVSAHRFVKYEAISLCL